MGQILRLERRAPSPAAEVDVSLVQAARAGSVGARQQLFEIHYPRIVGLAYRLLGRHDAAEDIAHDVFVEALRGFATLRDPRAFDGWIARICVFRVRSHIRRERIMRRLGLASAPIDPDLIVSPNGAPEVAADLRHVYARLQKMPPDTRIALVLRRVEGMRVREIAERMGISPATVKRRIEDARKMLEEGDR
jgi:RNA polymerase sigma-70 factor, ECF subfamily